MNGGIAVNLPLYQGLKSILGFRLVSRYGLAIRMSYVVGAGIGSDACCHQRGGGGMECRWVRLSHHKIFVQPNHFYYTNAQQHNQ
jgi:hypothetical protein